MEKRYRLEVLHHVNGKAITYTGTKAELIKTASLLQVIGGDDNCKTALMIFQTFKNERQVHYDGRNIQNKKRIKR